MKKIETTGAPAAIGPYSQGIIAGNLIFVSGQVPLNPKTGQMSGETIEVQARQVMENVKGILEEAGGSMESVVKTTCFLSRMEDFAKFNEIYAQYFTSCPARSCVAVKEIPKNALCEVEAIALLYQKEEDEQ